MTTRCKIGVAGTHSTGKSTFVSRIATAARGSGLRVAVINDLASRAREMGFPILIDHDAESTLWIMAECLRLEAEASLRHDLLLVDRPPIDALGYLEAALETTGRTIRTDAAARLEAIAASDAAGYDCLVATVLDADVPIGAGRDGDETYRRLAGRKILGLVERHAPTALRMTSANAEETVDAVVARLDALLDP